MNEYSSTGEQLLMVLETVARAGPLTVSEIAALHSLNRTVVHRLVATLYRRGYVIRAGRKFVLGPSVNLFVNADHYSGLRESAGKILREMAEERNETIVLHGVDGPDAIVVAQRESPNQLVCARHQPGSRHPLVLGASGLAILAFRPKFERDKLIKKARNSDDLAKRIETVRDAGYAITYDELHLGIHGLAVPLHTKPNDCTASLGLIIPVQRAMKLESFSGWLAQHRDRIERALTAGSKAD